MIELELGGGPRLLAAVGSGIVTLLAMGGHEVTSRYVRRNTLAADVRGASTLPPEFDPRHRDPLLPPPSRRPPKLRRWAPEVTPEWLYFLDDEQAQICDAIVEEIELVLADDDQYCVNFVIGGPGTGKTSILLQLLRRLSNQVQPNRETWSVGLDVTDRMADFITASVGWDLEESRRLAESPDEPDILLIDDPAARWEISSAAEGARTGDSAAAVVIAFDPLQLGESLSDAEYEELVEQHQAREWRLGTCYRQKEVVGHTALKVARAVAESSPFLDDRKQRGYAEAREELTRLANSLVFRNPSGYTVSHPDATVANWREHISWVRRQETNSTRWPSLLVIVDDEAGLPRAWLDELRTIRHERVRLGDIQEAIKGLEYHHVALVVSNARLQALQDGFTGSGRRRYDEYRLFRIPFTRARDSLAVFSRE